MGICCTKLRNKADHEIAVHMLQQKNVDKSVKKLLLLGSGSSGKSTLFKQLKCIFHEWGLDSSEYVDAAYSIRQNCVAGMLKLLQKSQILYDLDQLKYEKCRITLDDDTKIGEYIQVLLPFQHETFEFMEDNNPKWEMMDHLGVAIKYLWGLESIKSTFNCRGTKYSFPDNMDYFFDKVDKIFEDGFYPDHQDVLRCRIRTTGMVEITYEIQESFFNIYDVGGQRNERKKWIHSFEGVTAVIYVAALNHFDAVCFEDENKNAMHESIELFDNICNSKWFRKTAMILFLNKSDLFREKMMEQISIKYCFSEESQWKGEEFNGDEYVKTDNVQEDSKYFEYCYKEQINFIAKQYYAQRKNLMKNKKIYTHITNATNRNNIEQVFWDCQNIVIRKNLSNGGFA